MTAVSSRKRAGQVVDHGPGCGQATDADVERAVEPDLDELALGEVLPEIVVDRVVDREVVGREQIGVAERGAFGGREVFRLLGSFERADEVLADTVAHGVGVPDRHATPALVVERDPEPDQFDQPPRERPAVVDGLGERAEPLRDLRAVRHDPTDAELDAGRLVECGEVLTGRKG